MKQALKLIFSTLLGACIGFGAVMFCIILFTDISFCDFLEKMEKVRVVTLLLSCFLSFVCFFLVLFIQIILHESGHLLLGLATGYRFVSFRVGSFTLIEENGRFRFKRYSISGTGGQCLMSPPDKPCDQLPYFWYNAGGVLMNLLTAVVAFILWISFSEVSTALHVFLFFLFISGLFLTLMNGIPLKMSGITNDAYNLILMRKDPNCRKSLALQLSVNAESQKGVRLKDMPDKWFTDIEITDYSNIFQVAVKLIYASRYIDRKEFEMAQPIFNELMLHREELVGLYRKEIACECLFLELVGARRKVIIESLYTDELKKYILHYKNLMSSKQRLLCVLSLYWENKPEKAKEIYEKVSYRRDRYLLQGDVASDLDIMETLLKQERVLA